MSQLLSAARAVDALWDEPDPDTEDARDGLIWMTDDEAAMASALRNLRATLAELMEVSGGDPERYLVMAEKP